MSKIDSAFVLAALKNGHTESAIAAHLGVTQSAVSQYIDAHNLREIASTNSRFAQIDRKLDNVEEKVLNNLDKVVGTIYDPMKLTKILSVVNGAKRRSLAEGQQIVNNTTNVRLVNLTLPERALLRITKNAQNEVIAVGERNLTTIPAGKLSSIVQQKALAHKPATEDILHEEILQKL